MLDQEGQDGVTQQKSVPTLDTGKEKQTIKESLSQSGKMIKFLSRVATKSNFEETIRQKPTVLHISCHGVK